VTILNDPPGAEPHDPLGAEPLKKRKLYQEVLDRLIAAISSAEYPPGSQLPSERELMSRFEVGRPAIREAMLTLQQMGLVRISHGERARVVHPTADMLIERISSAMVVLLATNPRGLDNLKEARILMETGLVRLATARATPEGVARLSEVFQELKETKSGSAAFLSADMAFHVRIAEMSGNQLIASALRGMLEWLSRFKRDMVSVRGVEPVTISEHEKILEAMTAGDSDAAAHAMWEHLARANRLYLVAADAAAAEAAAQSKRRSKSRRSSEAAASTSGEP
jgi:DNA-binding FadR family transcriptional regulator